MKTTWKAEPQTRVESRKFLTADFINSIDPKRKHGKRGKTKELYWAKNDSRKYNLYSTKTVQL